MRKYVSLMFVAVLAAFLINPSQALTKSTEFNIVESYASISTQAIQPAKEEKRKSALVNIDQVSSVKDLLEADSNAQRLDKLSTYIWQCKQLSQNYENGRAIFFGETYKELSNSYERLGKQLSDLQDVLSTQTQDPYKRLFAHTLAQVIATNIQGNLDHIRKTNDSIHGIPLFNGKR